MIADPPAWLIWLGPIFIVAGLGLFGRRLLMLVIDRIRKGKYPTKNP